MAETKLDTYGYTKLKSAQVYILIGVLALLVCVGGVLTYQRLSQETFTEPTETLRIGNVGEYSVFNIIAKSQGYFEEQGIDAIITEYSSGPASMAALQEGKEDFNIAADFVGVRNIFNNPDIRILAEVNTHQVFQLVARRDNFETLEDIKGKRVGVTINSAGEYFLGNYLNFHNIDLSSITMVNQTPAEMLQGLEDGSIDAIVVFEPYIYNLNNKLGDTLVMWDLQENQTTNAILYSTKAYLDAHPDIAVRYLRALVKAEQYYMDQPEEALRIVRDSLKLDPGYQEYIKTRLIHNIALNQELLINMESQARWSIENKLTEAIDVPNYLPYIYFSALETVKPESVTVIR